MESLERRLCYAVLAYNFEAPDIHDPASGLSLSGTSALEGIHDHDDEISFSVSGFGASTGFEAFFDAAVSGDPLLGSPYPDTGDKTFVIELDGPGEADGELFEQTFTAEEIVGTTIYGFDSAVLIDKLTAGPGTVAVKMFIDGLAEGETWAVHTAEVRNIEKDIVWMTVSAISGNEGTAITGTVHRETLNLNAALVVNLTSSGIGTDPATRDTDYEHPSSVTIGSGNTTQTFSISLTDDNTPAFAEDTERFKIEISSSANYESSPSVLKPRFALIDIVDMI